MRMEVFGEVLKGWDRGRDRERDREIGGETPGVGAGRCLLKRHNQWPRLVTWRIQGLPLAPKSTVSTPHNGDSPHPQLQPRKPRVFPPQPSGPSAHQKGDLSVAVGPRGACEAIQAWVHSQFGRWLAGWLWASHLAPASVSPAVKGTRTPASWRL